MKMLVETAGNFMLLDRSGGQQVHAHRPSVITMTDFLETRALLKQIKILHQELSDEATDAEFHRYWKESKGDAPLAIQSFLSKFAVEAVSKYEEKNDEEAEAETIREVEIPRRGRKKAE